MIFRGSAISRPISCRSESLSDARPSETLSFDEQIVWIDQHEIEIISKAPRQHVHFASLVKLDIETESNLIEVGFQGKPKAPYNVPSSL